MNYWHLVFFTITKIAQPCQLGTRQFLERDHLVDSFQQKNRSSTPINAFSKFYWTIIIIIIHIIQIIIGTKQMLSCVQNVTMSSDLDLD